MEVRKEYSAFLELLVVQNTCSVKFQEAESKRSMQIGRQYLYVPGPVLRDEE